METNQEREAWRQYKRKRFLAQVIGVSIIGLIVLGRELYDKRVSAQAWEIYKEKEIEKAKFPSKDDYYILTNKERDAILKVADWSIDSIEFVLCKPLADYHKTRWALPKLYQTCRKKLKEITLSRAELLKANCNKGSCQRVLNLDNIYPFKVQSIIRFNGVELNILNYSNTMTSERKKIYLENAGLPIIIKEIHPPEGMNISLVKNSLPFTLESNSKVKLEVPLIQGFLPNSTLTEYMPYDFNILVESESNGEELYSVSFKDDNSKVNFSNLVTE